MIGIFLSIIGIIVIDQVSKFYVVKFLSAGTQVTVLPHLFSFDYIENRGAAFGILENSRWLFIVVTILAVGVLVFYVITKRPRHKLLCTSLALMGGGAIGNFIDRLFYGRVVDFIKTDFINFPIFNVADICLTIGVILLAVYIFFISDRKRS